MSAHIAMHRPPALSHDLRTLTRQLNDMDRAGLIGFASEAAELDFRAIVMQFDLSVDRAEDLEMPPTLPLSFRANVLPFPWRFR